MKESLNYRALEGEVEWSGERGRERQVKGGREEQRVSESCLINLFLVVSACLAIQQRQWRWQSGGA